MVYLPRCADTNPEVRKLSAQVNSVAKSYIVSASLICPIFY